MIGSDRYRAVVATISFLFLLSLAACDSAEQRAEGYYKSGVELAEKGEALKASLEFRNALKLKSNYVDALFALGEVEEKLARIPEAVSHYSAAAELDPKHLGARVKLASIMLAANNTDEALKYANEAFALNAKDPGVLVAKASIELRLGNSDEAVKLANQALDLDPGYVNALMVLAVERFRSGDARQALTLLEKAPEAEESNPALQLLRLTFMEALGDQPGVEKLFVRMIEIFPDNEGLKQGLVQWYMNKGRKDDAEKAVRKFAAEKPDDEIALTRLIAFLSLEKGPEAAMSEIEKLISDPRMGKELAFKMEMTLAQMQYASGRHTDASDLLRSLVAKTEGDQRNAARTQLAQFAATSKDFDEASALIDEVIKEDPKNANALGLRAAIRLETGKTAEATDDLLAAINEAPEDGKLRMLLGDAYDRTGLTSLAEEQYSKALALNDDPAAAGIRLANFLVRYGRTERARQIMEDVATRVPTDRRVLSLLGELRLRMQDWAGAEQISEKLRSLNEDKPDPTADRLAAAALSGMEKYSDSISLLKSSMSDEQTDSTVQAGLVRAYIQAGQIKEAEEFLKAQLDHNPKDVQAQVLLGSIYAGTQRPSEAEHALKSAVAMDDSPLSAIALTQYYISTGQDEDAEKSVRAGIDHNPDSEPLKFLLASVLQRQQRFDEAIDLYEDMHKSDPDSTAIINDLASLLSERRGDPASLARAYELAQRFQNSEVPQFLDTLGWIFYLKGEYASAYPLIKEATEKLPDVGLLQYHYGMVLKALDQPDLAIPTFEKAISMPASMTAPDLKKARSALEDLRKSGSGASN